MNLVARRLGEFYFRNPPQKYYANDSVSLSSLCKFYLRFYYTSHFTLAL